MSESLPAARIEKAILVIRDHNVMLDADLAQLYGVTTKRLNEQVKRNRGRFPDDFMFRLTPEEKAEVVANCDHLERLKFSRTLPHAFTEHGALMLASVLNTPIAVETSIFVVRAFIRMRAATISHRELSRRIDLMEKRYDAQFKVVFDAIRKLMEPPVRAAAIKLRTGLGRRVRTVRHCQLRPAAHLLTPIRSS